jgi:hypothetical protein
MNTQTSQDQADQQLRDLLAEIDPERGRAAQAPTHLLDRVLFPTGAEDSPAGADAAGADRAPGAPQTAGSTGRPSFLARHWQGALLAAATVATLALAAPSILPGVGPGGGNDEAVSSADVAVRSEGGAGGLPPGAGDDVAAEAGESALAQDMADGQGVTGSAAVPGADTEDQTLVRSGSLLVGTEDVAASRNAFVATVLGMGGRITSETVVTEDSAGRIDPYEGEEMLGRYDMGVSYPYPWYPTGPGIWLSVEVPAEDYDEAVEAARSTGEVIRMQQSSYDVGTQISDVDARIEALEASLARLTALMDQAEGISEVIALEQAISQRQSELDSLRARQRDLANQTAMSQISLALMSPEDARQTVDPQPDQSWWESFLDGLREFWQWLGSALLIASPLAVAMAIIWWARRRRTRRPTGSGTGQQAQPGQPGQEPAPPADPADPGSGD